MLLSVLRISACCEVPELQLQGDTSATEEHEQQDGWEDVI